MNLVIILFDTLCPIEVTNINTTQNLSVYANDDDNPLDLPLSKDTLWELQQKDDFCVNITTQIKKGNITDRQLYIIQDQLLKRICCRW